MLSIACHPTDIADWLRKPAKGLWLLSPSSGGSSSFTDGTQPFIAPKGFLLRQDAHPVQRIRMVRPSRDSIGVDLALSRGRRITGLSDITTERA